MGTRQTAGCLEEGASNTMDIVTSQTAGRLEEAASNLAAICERLSLRGVTSIGPGHGDLERELVQQGLEVVGVEIFGVPNHEPGFPLYWINVQGQPSPSWVDLSFQHYSWRDAVPVDPEHMLLFCNTGKAHVDQYIDNFVNEGGKCFVLIGDLCWTGKRELRERLSGWA